MDDQNVFSRKSTTKFGCAVETNPLIGCYGGAFIFTIRTGFPKINECHHAKRKRPRTKRKRLKFAPPSPARIRPGAVAGRVEPAFALCLSDGKKSKSTREDGFCRLHTRTKIHGHLYALHIYHRTSLSTETQSVTYRSRRRCSWQLSTINSCWNAWPGIIESVGRSGRTTAT